MKKNLGIDIGDGTIKFVFDDNFLVIDTPENAVNNGSLITFEAMSDLLKETVKHNNIREKKVSLIIPDEDVFLNRLNMPYMNTKQLEVNLPYEFKELVGNNKDDYIYDYSIISCDEKNGIELLGAAVRKDLIAKYSEMFDKAGLKLVKAMPRQMAITNILLSKGLTSDIALLDIGYNHVRVDIYKDGFYNASRTLENGVLDMAKIASEILFCDKYTAFKYLKSNKMDVLSNEKMQEFYDDCAVRIARAINYYTYENRDNKLDTLYIYGGGSHYTNFVKAIINASPIKCKLISDLLNDNDLLDVLDAYGLNKE